MTAETDNITTVARHAVEAMVAGHIEVSVDADRLLKAAADQSRARPGHQAVGAVVSVELVGPADAPHRPSRTVSAKGEARAWGSDEVVSAARRAAERILESNPTWRRTAR